MDSQELNQLVKQLKDSDPGQRRAAIIALGKSGEQDALRPLADVYRTDPDESLRELALKAGRHLRNNAGQTAPAPEPEPLSAPPLYEEDDEDEYDDEPGLVIVSEEDEKRAQVFVEEAMSVSMRGNNARAIKSLRKALDINPNLAQDSYYLSVAAAVMELESEDVVDALRDKSQVREFVKSSEKQKRDLNNEEHMEEVRKFTFASVSLDLIIFLVISVLGSVLSPLILAQGARGYIENVNNNTIEQDLEIFELAAGFAFGTADPLSLILVGLATAAIGMVSILIQTGIVHVAARYILRGHGTWSYLIYKILAIYNRLLIVNAVLSTLAVWMIFFMGSEFIAACFMIPLAIFNLIQFGSMLSAVGEAYNFGLAMGCLSILIGTIGISILVACVFTLLGAALATLLQQFGFEAAALNGMFLPMPMFYLSY